MGADFTQMATDGTGNIELPIRLRRNLGKTLRLLAISLGFVAGGIWMIQMHYLWGYVCVPFFGLGAVVFCIQLLPNSAYLELTEEGFVCRTLFRRAKLMPWKKIARFGSVRVRNVPMAVYELKPEFINPTQRARMAAVFLDGWDGGFTDAYGGKPEKLVELMNFMVEEYGIDPGAKVAPG